MNINIYLTNQKPISSSKLKKHLYQEKIKKKCCEICKLSEWLGKPIILHLHHVNGNNKDNSIENLQILCPNCHSQTSNYAGRKKLKIKEKISDERVIEAIQTSYNKRQALLKLGLTAYGASYNRINRVIEKYKVGFLFKPMNQSDIKRLETIKKIYGSMKELSEKRRYEEKIEWPNKEELENLLKSNSCVKVAKELGVSDNSVRKRAQKYGIDLKSISIWSQKHGKNKNDAL